MTPTITCPNPDCKRQHSLFWNVGHGGTRVLSYRCDRCVAREIETKYGTVDSVHYTTRVQKWEQPVPDPTGIPEEWSRGYAEEQKNKAQGQLSMFYKP